ncbi:TM2 domain-containing protein [Streptomyces sp. SBT349]|uniref:TM2 domain-containing protein n=1 Tax=Streptomyces sp. SBT349 TaxID=1580539 RepID=UPI00066BE0B5|nr:TM2 domain-containing protein [Streptomyces sp. SBT349]
MSDQNPYQPQPPGSQPPGAQPGQPGQQPGGYGYPQPGAYQQPGAYPQPGQPGGQPGQPGYAGQGYPQDPSAPFGYDPMGRPLSPKSKIVAGVLQILLGGVGAGRWYTGHTGMAIAQLLTCGGFGIWALIDGIIFLTSNDRTDASGRVLKS